MRERLYSIMWDDVGILRSAESLARGTAALDALARDIAACGVADASRRYNLTWMDRLNLENLTLVSRAICAAADFRRDSRGAHFREDFPQAVRARRLALYQRAARATTARGDERSRSISPACGRGKACCGRPPPSKSAWRTCRLH